MVAKIIALQIDELESLNPDVDSSLQIAWAFEGAKYDVFVYTPMALVLSNDTVHASGKFIKRASEGNNYQIVSSNYIDLAFAECIFIRQNPPLDMNYITSTYILDHIKDRTKIYNNPEAIRNYSEKLSIYKFRQYTLPTIVTSSAAHLLQFLKKHKICVLKPLYQYGGIDIIKARHLDTDEAQITDYLTKYNFVMMQKFITIDHDIRIIALNGKCVGAIKRSAPQGDFRANLCLGGKASAVILSAPQQKMCDEIATSLKADGILLAGIDIIGCNLIEINVTSPTCLKQFKDLYNIDIAEKIVLAHLNISN